MEKYYEKKAIKNGAPRKCKGCPGFLSRYNSDAYCSKCVKIKISAPITATLLAENPNSISLKTIAYKATLLIRIVIVDKANSVYN